MKKRPAIGAAIAIILGTAVALGWFHGPRGDVASTPTPTVGTQRTVMLYFYRPDLDRDAAGNVQCTAKGTVSAKRDIPFTNTPIQDTIRLLLTTAPTFDEKAEGSVSEFPLEGVTLTTASLASGTLTLTFNDPDHRTGGGSCFVSILRAQVEKTAKQFPGVTTVRLLPEDLFQP